MQRHLFQWRIARVALAALAFCLAGCSATMHHRAGMSSMDKGEYRKAIKELQQAVELAPEDIHFRKDWLQSRETATHRLLSAADKALAEGNPGKAENNFRSVLSYDPSNVRALGGIDAIRGSVLATEDASRAREALKRGDPVEATQWNKRALQRLPQLPEARAVERDIEAMHAKEMITVEGLGALYRKPINLEFRDASVKMVFDALARTAGINFIFDRDVKTEQRTTVVLKQTTLEDAIDAILTTNQLEKKVLNANSILIYPNTESKTREYQDLVVKAFYLAHVEAKQAAGLLKTILKIKDVFADDKYNMLVLRESPDTIALAERLIALHDLEEPEVMLEVEVLEVNRSRLLNLGIQFTDQFTITPLPAGAGSSTSVLRLSELLALNRDKLGITLPSATINMQKVDGDANLLANPRLRVRDREKAKILIGDKVPVVTTTTTPNGFLSENIQYLDVGIKLEVEPEIRLHDEIGLKMSLEVSSLVSTVKTSTGSQAYQIGTRNFSSALRLKDGETQVLAGLISDAERSSANRVPLLGDVPLLGRLFSSQKDDRQKTEIVLSITPHLIRNMRRKDPASESFWSGTEATLRSKVLRPSTAEPSERAAEIHPLTPVVNNSGISLQWKGNAQAQVGESVTVELAINSVHLLRAAPLQLAFDPSELEVVSVKQGEFFSKDGKGSFSQAVDNATGRVSVSLAGNDAGTKGEGKLLTVVLKPLAATAQARISLIGMTPIGASSAVSQPPLPLPYQIAIVP